MYARWTALPRRYDGRGVPYNMDGGACHTFWGLKKRFSYPRKDLSQYSLRPFKSTKPKNSRCFFSRCVVLELQLGGGKNSGHAHKTGPWFLLVALFKFPTSSPVPFTCEFRLPEGSTFEPSGPSGRRLSPVSVA